MLFEFLGLMKASYDLHKAECEMYREMREEEERQREEEKRKEELRIEKKKRREKYKSIAGVIFLIAFLAWVIYRYCKL